MCGIGMGGLKLMELMAIIPATMLLAVSFFILLSLRKVEEKNLKTFGIVIAVLLWISAALIFSSGVYKMATGRPMMPMKHHMMKMPIEQPMVPQQ